MSENPVMRAYLVSREDDVDYDEHDAFVVVAADAEDARAVVLERFPPPAEGQHDWSSDRGQRKGFATATVTEIDLTQRGEVLGSFNAG